MEGAPRLMRPPGLDLPVRQRRRVAFSMTALAEMGAIIAPPVPAFYTNPQTVDDIVNFSIDRVMDLLGLPGQTTARWQGGRA